MAEEKTLPRKKEKEALKTKRLIGFPCFTKEK
jgi:hypothetical protein